MISIYQSVRPPGMLARKSNFTPSRSIELQYHDCSESSGHQSDPQKECSDECDARTPHWTIRTSRITRDVDRILSRYSTVFRRLPSSRKAHQQYVSSIFFVNLQSRTSVQASSTPYHQNFSSLLVIPRYPSVSSSTVSSSID